jgi:hypothetical protein
MIPESPDALLSRVQTAGALTAVGYPIAPTTLANKAARGEGPCFQRFGRKPLYKWGDALAWARSQVTAPRPKGDHEADVSAGVAA